MTVVSPIELVSTLWTSPGSVLHVPIACIHTTHPPHICTHTLTPSQVSGCALHRDQHATATGLRVPPRVVTTNSESLQHLEQLSRGFDPGDLLPLAAQVSSMSMESLPMTVLTENSARQHRAAYEARKMLPRVRGPAGL